MALSGITVIGLSALKRRMTKLKRKIENPDKALLTEIGMFMQLRIKERTAEGKDVDGTLFEPYSPAYKVFRQKKGHPVNKVNLFFTGSMMSSMTFRTGGNEVELYFLNTSDPSGARNPQKAFFLNEDRTFFSLSEQDVEDIVEIVNDYYRDILRQPNVSK
jgi:phage gpG-like protein